MDVPGLSCTVLSCHKTVRRAIVIAAGCKMIFHRRCLKVTACDAEMSRCDGDGATERTTEQTNVRARTHSRCDSCGGFLGIGAVD